MENLTLIIPAKFEKESLPTVLMELKKYNLKTIIILEKTDEETINSIQNFNCSICYQDNVGYGDALIKGIHKVSTKYFCIFNADGSFDPSELMGMYNLANYRDIDFVFGSRYMKNSGSKDDTVITFVGNKIFTFLGNLFFSLNISDILYTYVLGNTEKAKSLNLIQRDFGFCVELPIKANREKFILKSFPSYERPRIGGKKKVNAFKDGFKILIKMIKLFFS
ncbi:glycosyltransferase [Candidatus Pelagibacter sp.]|uniref:glycosyltransferase n=1 Tax=Candidatus Pelagibacter sp. TaxID=2024849 RepID=UPI003F878DAF